MKQQQGRTLIETLSILCIIGILSVFGLKLYAKAMNSVRANYIMQQVFIKANSLVENPVATRHKIVDTDFQSDKLSYGYSFGKATHNNNDKKFYIYLKGYFSKNLCEMLKKNIATDEYPGLKMLVAQKSGQANVELTVNTGACPSETETMIFHINDDFKNATQNKSNKTKSIPVVGKKKTKQPVTCNIEGALSCNPLVCDEANGYAKDAWGGCSACAPGFYCE